MKTKENYAIRKLRELNINAPLFNVKEAMQSRSPMRLNPFEEKALHLAFQFEDWPKQEGREASEQRAREVLPATTAIFDYDYQPHSFAPPVPEAYQAGRYGQGGSVGVP